MKRALGFFLALIMLLSAVPAFAANVRTSGPYTYEIKGNGTITITAFNWAENEGDIYIPNMLDGYVVAGIGDNAFRFSGNSNTSVHITLPNGIKTIGDFAFWMSNIASINIPESVQHIGKGAFVGCFNAQFKLAPNHPYFATEYGVLYNKARKAIIAYAGGVNTHYTIPEGIQAIEDYAFAYCAGMPGVEIELHFPTTLKSIGNYAFYGSRFAFGNESWGAQMNFADTGIESIGDYAFANTTWVPLRDSQEINFPASLQHIGEHSFEGVSVASGQSLFVFPQDCMITVIPDYAFYNMSDSVSVVVLSPITVVGNYAFYKDFGEYPSGKEYPASTLSMDHLSQIDCADIESIGEYSGFGFVFNVQPLPEQLTTLPAGFLTRGAFISELPETVTHIQSNAFSRMIANFKLPASLQTIAVDAFTRDTTFIVVAGSYAELWASENGFAYSIEGQDNMNWLND